MPQTPGRKQKQLAKQKGAAGKGSTRIDGISKRVVLGGLSIGVVAFVVGIYGPGRGGSSLFELPREFDEYQRWLGLGIIIAAAVSLYMVYLAKFYRELVSSPAQWIRAKPPWISGFSAFLGVM